MGKRCVIFLFFSSLSFAAIDAEAIVLGGSNLAIFGYADHSCNKPSKPYKPYQFYSEFEIDNYNLSVRRYNSELDSYIDCIKEYIENSENDMRRIREKIQEAINEAQRSF